MNGLDVRRCFLLGAAAGRIYLYKEGETFESLTGGWDDTLTARNNTGSLTMESEYMELAAAGTLNLSNPRRAAAVTQNQINTAGRSALHLEFSFDFIESASTVYIALYSSDTAYDANYIAAVGGQGSSVNERKTITLDLTEYQGLYHIGVMYFRDDGSPNNYYVSAFVHNVWME